MVRLGCSMCGVGVPLAGFPIVLRLCAAESFRLELAATPLAALLNLRAGRRIGESNSTAGRVPDQPLVG